MNSMIEGWFAAEPEPHLIGGRCTSCGSYAFPPTAPSCPNPSCSGTELEPVSLSRRGRLWSWTVARYAPPPPYVAADPFVPFALAAVELPEERMVVLGQIHPAADLAGLAVGDEMEVVSGTLPGDDATPIWNWRPA
jgi:uncharacterized OB-fold protein